MDTFTSDIKTYDSTEIEETIQNNNKLQLHWSALSNFFSFSFWTGKDKFWFMSAGFFSVYYKRYTEQWTEQIVLIPVALTTLPSKLHFLWLQVYCLYYWPLEKKELFVTYVLISNVNSLMQTYELFYVLILHLMGKMSQ